VCHEIEKYKLFLTNKYVNIKTRRIIHIPMHNVLELSGKHWPGERCYLLETDYFGPNAHIVD
jgi:hypothetical protein